MSGGEYLSRVQGPILIGRNLGLAAPEPANIFRNRPRIDKVRQMLVEVSRESIDIAKQRPTSPQELAKFAELWSRSGQDWPKSPNMVEIEPLADHSPERLCRNDIPDGARS